MAEPVQRGWSMEKVDVRSQIVVEKARIADPAPLGLASFALITFILSAHNAGWAQDITWMGLAFFYGGLCQLLAGMWEFSRDNTFAATAFSTYGGFWMSLSFTIILDLLGLLPADFDLHNALGWFLAAFFVFNVYMTACALLTNYAVFAVFFLLSVTFALLFIGEFCAEGNNWHKAGGYFGIFTAAAAWYASFAFCFNAVAKYPVIFVGGPLILIEKPAVEPRPWGRSMTIKVTT